MNAIARAVNALLRPFDAQLVGRGKPGLEFRMSSMLQRLSHRGLGIRTVVDIGASDGKWSAGNLDCFPDASFLAVEPLEERRPALERAKQKFNSFDYALCVAGAVDGETCTLNVSADLDGSTVAGQNPGAPRSCPVRTIDSLLAEKKLPGPYLLKFDTHGYELPILQGCGSALKYTAAILMETYNFQLTPSSLRFHEMCGHLESLGFRPADIADPMLRVHDGAFWQVDILLLKKDSQVFQYPHYR